MLDKIKELVTTCDSKNIELAIAIGVNMEGYSREVLVNIIMCTLADNKDKLYSIKEANNINTIVYNARINIYGCRVLGIRLVNSLHRIHTIEEWIDAYLSL
jgi:hypothetical protein